MNRSTTARLAKPMGKSFEVAASPATFRWHDRHVERSVRSHPNSVTYACDNVSSGRHTPSALLTAVARYRTESNVVPVPVAPEETTKSVAAARAAPPIQLLR